MPSENSLHIALQENYNHARHQEILREKVVVSYGAAWGAAIVFVYSKAKNFSDYPVLFLLISIISIPVIIGTLKWSFEFGNHIAAISALSLKLKINKSRRRKDNDSSGEDYLPFNEFHGFMALPLRTPFYLNVALTLVVIECSGFALSSSIVAYAFFKDRVISIMHLSINWTQSQIAITIFCLFLFLSSFASWRAYRNFLNDITDRIQEDDQTIKAQKALTDVDMQHTKE